MHYYYLTEYLQIFQKLNVRMVVSHVITWTNGDEISALTINFPFFRHMYFAASQLKNYRNSVSEPHDAMMLLT